MALSRRVLKQRSTSVQCNISSVTRADSDSNDSSTLNRRLFSLAGTFPRVVGGTLSKNERCDDTACQNERHSTKRVKDSVGPLNENIFQQELRPDQHQKQPLGPF